MTEFYWQAQLWTDDCPRCDRRDKLLDRRRLDDDSLVDTSCLRCMTPTLFAQAEAEVRGELAKMAVEN